MNRSRGLVGPLVGLALVVGLVACERPPVEVEQTGYRGTGMQDVENPRTREANLEQHQVPDPLAPAPGVGPKAGDIYQNVEVLGDLSVAQFQRSMRAITQWVAPEQGCNYCHVPGNFASEDKYTKGVSRKMLQMTRHINNEWQPHVANVGVTCYTCHRGQNVPEQIWFREEQDDMFTNAGNRYMQNKPVPKNGYTSLPRDALTAYLDNDESIRVQGEQALPSGDGAAIQHTERTYSLMIHMSRSLGVSCQVCHNSRAFGDWEQSPPQRTTAWHGIRMVRDANNNYLEPLTSVFPEYRLGPQGDVGKVSCATCHQGIRKPLYGEPMVQDYTDSLIGKPADGGESTSAPSIGRDMVEDYATLIGDPEADAASAQPAVTEVALTPPAD